MELIPVEFKVTTEIDVLLTKGEKNYMLNFNTTRAWIIENAIIDSHKPYPVIRRLFASFKKELIDFFNPKLSNHKLLDKDVEFVDPIEKFADAKPHLEEEGLIIEYV